MQYLLLIHSDPAIGAERSDEDTKAILGEYFEFTVAMAEGAAERAVGRRRDRRPRKYRYLHSTRADLLRRLGRRDEARPACERSLELTRDGAEREFLAGRVSSV